MSRWNASKRSIEVSTTIGGSLSLCRCSPTRVSWLTKVLAVIDERQTSKTGSRCGHIQPMPLWKRTYRCGNCGLEIDRDEHSAINIRERFAFPAPVHTRVIPCGVRLFSPQ